MFLVTVLEAMRVLLLLFSWLFSHDNNLFSELEITKLAFTLYCIFSDFVIYCRRNEKKMFSRDNKDF